MTIETLLAWITGRSARSLNTPVEYLEPVDKFQSVLHNERKRADRGQTMFSLLVFTPVAEGNQRAAIDLLAQRLQKRIRTTDTAGFLDERRIAVILPCTPTHEAVKIADDVCVPADGWIAPERDIYTYPSHRPLPTREDTTVAKTPVAETVQATASVQARPAEALFIQRIPLWKRTADIAGAVVGLIVLTPLLLLTALAIRLTSRGPVLFTQRREGLGGKAFTIYKFRTMCIDAEAKKAALRQFSEQDGPAFKIKHDPRITSIGRFLRKSCIDELPQLWNVLKGDMSLVGPRPLPCDESQQCSSWERSRLEVTPGLTCIWQVHGKSRVTFTEWMRMDIRYMRARTVFQDVKLVLHTLLAVIFHRASH